MSFLFIYTSDNTDDQVAGAREKTSLSIYTIIASYLSGYRRLYTLKNVPKQLIRKYMDNTFCFFWGKDIRCVYPEYSQLQMPPNLPDDETIHIMANPITYSHRYRASKTKAGGRTRN